MISLTSQIFKIRIFLTVFLIISIKQGTSQILYNNEGHIPYQNQTNWSVAGLLPGTPTIANNVFDVTKEVGVSWDDKVNSALTKAKAASGNSIIYFPALPGGQAYILRQPIVLEVNDGNNIIFQGDDSGATILEFDMPANNNCFDVRGEGLTQDVNLTTDLMKREKTFSVDNANNFEAGDWIHLEQPNFNYSQTTDWRASIGQITQIVGKVGNIITIKDEASKNYFSSSDPSPQNETIIAGIKPIQNIGIENLKIRRLGDSYSSTSDLGYNVYFKYAVNCWIKGVEMERTAKNHVGINRSSHIEVSGCYFNSSISYGSGGFGYGVQIEMSTTNCLIENNIFRHLRHAIMVANGANCNVFSYNYSREQYWTGIGGIRLPQGSDLVLHGGYAFSNLFEENIVERIEADRSYTKPPFWGYHGINGPFNAFVRNIAIKGNPLDIDDFHDITLNNAESTSVIGCMVGDINTSGNTSLTIDLYGREVLRNQTYETGKNLSHPSSIIDLIKILSNFNIWLADVSYYYSSRPDFLSSNFKFPTLGPGEPFISNFPYISHIPASDRWFNSKVRYVTAKPTSQLTRTLNEDMTLNGVIYITNDITIPANYSLTIEPGTIVHFADDDTINLTIQGSLLIGSDVQFETGENGNTKVILTGSQTLTIPSNVYFQIRESSELVFNVDVNIDAATFIAGANANISIIGDGSIDNSVFIKDPASTIQLRHGSTNLSITNSEFRYPSPDEDLIAKRGNAIVPTNQTIQSFGIQSESTKIGIDADNSSGNLPTEYNLFKNYPNPFNPTTNFKYALPKNSYVVMKIYNVLGQQIKTLVDEPQSAGYKTVTWDGKNDRGDAVAGGIYIYRLVARSLSATSAGGQGDYVFVKSDKMILLK